MSVSFMVRVPRLFKEKIEKLVCADPLVDGVSYNVRRQMAAYMQSIKLPNFDVLNFPTSFKRWCELLTAIAKHVNPDLKFSRGGLLGQIDNGIMSEEVLALVEKVHDLDADDGVFVAWRSGSLEEFRDKYLPFVDRKFAIGQSGSEQLVLCDLSEPVSHMNPTLAKLRLRGAVAGRDQLAVGCDLTCPPNVKLGHDRISVIRGEMHLIGGELTQSSYEYWSSRAATPVGSNLELYFIGNKICPRWEVRSKSGGPIGDGNALEAFVAHLEGFVGCNSQSGKFRVCISDINNSYFDVTPNTGADAAERLMRAFKAQLRSQLLLKPDENGFVTLASHQLHLERGGNERA